MKKNLAEVAPNGDIKIIRMTKEDEGKTQIDFTVIQATDYNMLCGNCGNVVFYKRIYQASPAMNIMNSWGTIMTYYANN